MTMRTLVAVTVVVGLWACGGEFPAGGGAPVRALHSELGSPDASTSFLGLAYSTSIGRIPPDTTGAVGPNHVVTTLNTEVRVQSKTGVVASTVTLASFWSTTGASAPFDPRIVWHPGMGRYVTIAVSNARGTDSSLLLGVSQTDDPTGSWDLYRFDVDSTNTDWADFPTLGFNDTWVVVAFNLFSRASDTFQGSEVYAIGISGLLGSPPSAAGSRFSSTFATLQPSTTLDRGASDVWLATAAGFTGGSLGLALFRLSGPASSPTLDSPATALGFPSPQAYAFDTPSLPQLGTTTRINGNLLSGASVQSAVTRFGRVHVTHAIGLPASSPNRSSIQVWELDPRDGGSIVRTSRIDDDAGVRHYAYPSLAVNGAGDVLVGFSQFTPGTYASAGYSVRLANDFPALFRDDHVFKAGEASYTLTGSGSIVRWGDYSATMVDPADDCSLWSIQEYAATGNTWSTWWARLAPQTQPPAFLATPSVAPVLEDALPFTVTFEARRGYQSCLLNASAVTVAGSTSTALVVAQVDGGPSLPALDGGLDGGPVQPRLLLPALVTLVRDGNGPATIRLALSDGSGTASQDVSFTVREVNDVPDAGPDVASTPEDTPVALAVATLLGNDAPGPANEASQTLTLVAFDATSAQGATLVRDGGLLLYRPAADRNGLDSFGYTVRDDGTTAGAADPRESVGRVTVDVAPVNDPPRLGAALTVGTDEDTPLVLSSAAAFTGTPGPGDESAQSLVMTAVVATTAASGTASLSGSQLTYTPPRDFNGTDTISFTVSDDGLPAATATGTLIVNVRPVNDAPDAGADVVDGTEDVPLFVSEAQLLANDLVGPSDEVAVQRLTVDSLQVVDGGGAFSRVDGGFLFTPGPDVNGAVAASSRVVDDGTPAQASLAPLTVRLSEVNDAPLAADDSAATQEDTPIAIRVLDTDVPGPANESGQRLTIVAVSPTNLNGTVTVDGGVVLYVPRRDEVGNDAFTYTVQDDGTTDGGADFKRATARVSVTIAAVNDPPILAPVEVEGTEDTVLTVPQAQAISGSAGPNDELSQTLTVTRVEARTSQGGQATLTATAIVYTPPRDFNGLDVISLTVSDDGVPAAATSTELRVRVAAVNDAPDAGPDVVRGREDQPAMVSPQALLSNDTAGPPDEASQRLRVVNLTSGDGLTITPGATGFTVAAPADLNGTFRLQQRVSDDGVPAQQSETELTLVLDEVNDPPVPGADDVFLERGRATAVELERLLSNDVPGPVNEASQTLRITAAEGLRGTVELVEGVVRFIPASDFSEGDAFTYTVTDDGTTAGQADPRSVVATVKGAFRPGCGCASTDWPAAFLGAWLLLGRRRSGGVGRS